MKLLIERVENFHNFIIIISIQLQNFQYLSYAFK